MVVAVVVVEGQYDYAAGRLFHATAGLLILPVLLLLGVNVFSVES